MGILVKDAPDGDILHAVEMELAAYANNAANPILFPGPFPPDFQQQRASVLVAERQKDPSARYLEAVDEDSGEIYAFSKWHIYETAESTNKISEPETFGTGSNPVACDAFFGGIARRNKAMFGIKPHIYLHMLHADPKAQGRGAGRALLSWGIHKADELRLPLYLRSSPDAHPFYQRFGFEDIEVFRLDIGKIGGGDSKWHIAPLMTRLPVTK